ncbi:hypothetical protein KQX54_014377 [Cotesia glomerata]|uniref:Uncharacterized protein n=1 Tax=Cotesia glomerata TaxID=32391 RepID=A0AAV7I8U0_COTGL|nr:hypothetical protein KQX54_014377 [Cotesia glomerata]
MLTAPLQPQPQSELFHIKVFPTEGKHGKLSLSISGSIHFSKKLDGLCFAKKNTSLDLMQISLKLEFNIGSKPIWNGT